LVPPPWRETWPVHILSNIFTTGSTVPSPAPSTRVKVHFEDALDVELSLTVGGPGVQPVPVDEPLATLDRHTHQGLTTGRVTLPGRTVHAGVWFRLLRSLLDEVSLALTTRSKHDRATLEQIWQATGRPERGGLTIWRPYEQLDWGTQEAMLHAAAIALHLAAHSPPR
jgi:hypothetical protein